MPLNITCPHCHVVLSVPDSAAGKSGKCPKCGNTIQVPATPATHEHPRQAVSTFATLDPEMPARMPLWAVATRRPKLLGVVLLVLAVLIFWPHGKPQEARPGDASAKSSSSDRRPGLGISFAHVAEILSKSGEWNWTTKHDSPDGTISYAADNPKHKKLAILVVGHPDNLDRIVIASMARLEAREGPLTLALPCVYALALLGDLKELNDWYVKHFLAFQVGPHPRTLSQSDTVAGHQVLVEFRDITDENVFGEPGEASATLTIGSETQPDKKP